jgi:hypothetical protein
VQRNNIFRDQANKTCEQMGAWIVTLDSAEENDQLYQWLKSSQHFEWNEWFLGPFIGIYATEDNTDVFR